MKKIKFFQTQGLLTLCLLIGMMFFANLNMNAQTTPAYVYTQEITQNRIPELQALQSNYSSSSAKWQVCQDAIDYYNQVIADFNSPNPAVVSALADTDFFNHDLIRRANEFTVLYNYNAAQLAALQAEYDAGVVQGLDQNPTGMFQKIAWILEANAY